LEIGYFTLVLHSHLPFVRHPEHEYFLEEDWLFEAITETYIPLIEVFENLEKDKIDFRITLSLTPTLLAMLDDELLQYRYVRHLDNLIELTEKELKRNQDSQELMRLSQMYKDHFIKCKYFFTEKYALNLIKAFKYFQDKGFIEIITCGATHGFFPLIEINKNAVHAQVKVACDDYKRFFDRNPNGIWLPECGFSKECDIILRKNEIKYFFLDAHGIIYGHPRPTFGNYAPIRCPSGVHAFSRDIETSKMVWSKEHGYPGDVYYREFFRDIGFELDYDYLKPFVNPDGSRKHTGIKYYRITDRHTNEKMLYDLDIAGQRIDAHSSHFLSCRLSQARKLKDEIHKNPLIVSTYDAELFGHWWFEGPKWIDSLIRKIAYKQYPIKMITPSEYLLKYPYNQEVTPCKSSWGDKGYNEFWLNNNNDWIYKHLHIAGDRMFELAQNNGNPSILVKRALNQAARELLLAQSSDWAFIMTTKTMTNYAIKRFKSHIARFTVLYNEIKNSTVNEERLSELESLDNIFPNIDYSIYSKNINYL